MTTLDGRATRDTVTVRERDVPITNGSLFAIERGAGRGLLFLHGVSATAYVWLAVMDRLSEWYHTVALDQRGHGRSGVPRDRRFDAEAYARDAVEVAALSESGPIVVVGHSLGARNALEAAVRRPDLIAGVVAIEFTPFVTPAVFDALDDRVAGGARSFSDLEDVVAYLTVRYPRLGPEALARRAQHGYARGNDGAWWALADTAAMRATCAGLREDLAPALRTLSVPTVLVRGDDSAFVSQAAFDASVRLRLGLQSVIVDGADHYVPEERPDDVARIVHELASEVFGTAFNPPRREGMTS